MKFSPELLVGLLFLVAMAVLGVVTILVADIPVWTSRGPVWEVMFDSVSGLEPGNNVSVSGMVVGRVAKMELQGDGTVKVFLEIRQGQDLVLHEGYAVMVKDISALGGKVVDIRIGDPMKVEVDPRRLQGTVVPNVMDAGGELVSALKDDLRTVMSNLRLISDDIRDGKGVLGQLIRNRDLGNMTGEMVGDAHAAIKRLSSITRDIKLLSGRVARGKGTLGKIFQDEELYRKALALVRDLSEIASQIRSGKGMLGRLAYEDGMYQDLKAAVASLRQISVRIAEGKGTIGKMVQDEELYRDLRGALNNFNESVEDAREQAPVTTFVSVLFSAF